MSSEKRWMKILIILAMMVVFLLVLLIFIFITQASATAENLKRIKILEQKVEKLEHLAH